MSSLHERVRLRSRDEYIERVLANADGASDDIEFPGLPPSAVQLNFVGLSGRLALSQAAEFYRFVVRALERAGQPLGDASRVLDFGVGWGRILRFFAYDVPEGGLFGADVDPDILREAEAARVPGNLFVTTPHPPLPIAETFDLVYAFSVFSHLNEATATAWVREFARHLHEGGTVVLTTRARAFIELCAALRSRSGSDHENVLATLFPNTEEALHIYDSGAVVHEPSEGGPVRPATFYGETAIPRSFMAEAWSEYFDLIDWHDDPFPGSFQSVAVLQRRR